MNKRYQVFVSSTYTDLQAERSCVIQMLMQLDCIPAGMELFSAADETQWDFIKKVIDDSDYYLLIIGARYGSITTEGISYTEKEFDYAVQKGLNVIALLHGNPGNISFDKSETSPDLIERLNNFKKKITHNRLVSYWQQATDLPSLVAVSITKAIKTYPATGWVRANQIPNEDILFELNEVRKENQELQKIISALNDKYNLESMDSKFIAHGELRECRSGDSIQWKITTSWKEIFSLISPYLMEHPANKDVQRILNKSLREIDNDRICKKNKGPHNILFFINDQVFKTITIQLIAYNLIKTEYSPTTVGRMDLFWHLTEKGERFMIESRTICQPALDDHKELATLS